MMAGLLPLPHVLLFSKFSSIHSPGLVRSMAGISMMNRCSHACMSPSGSENCIPTVAVSPDVCLSLQSRTSFGAADPDTPAGQEGVSSLVFSALTMTMGASLVFFGGAGSEDFFFSVGVFSVAVDGGSVSVVSASSTRGAS